MAPMIDAIFVFGVSIGHVGPSSPHAKSNFWGWQHPMNKRVFRSWDKNYVPVLIHSLPFWCRFWVSLIAFEPALQAPWRIPDKEIRSSFDSQCNDKSKPWLGPNPLHMKYFRNGICLSHAWDAPVNGQLILIHTIPLDAFVADKVSLNKLSIPNLTHLKWIDASCFQWWVNSCQKSIAPLVGVKGLDQWFQFRIRVFTMSEKGALAYWFDISPEVR